MIGVALVATTSLFILFDKSNLSLLISCVYGHDWGSSGGYNSSLVILFDKRDLSLLISCLLDLSGEAVVATTFL